VARQAAAMEPQKTSRRGNFFNNEILHTRG